MAAPDYVPLDRTQLVRSYESPPRRPQPWRADRPGDLRGYQPRGDLLGAPGPDQGYVLLLAERFRGKLTLTEGERERDALAGACAVALKRASLLGRAPVLHDLTVALTIWGFLGEAPADLVAVRRTLFAEVSSPHHYAELRRVADLVPPEALRHSPQQVASAHALDWRSLLDPATLPA